MQLLVSRRRRRAVAAGLVALAIALAGCTAETTTAYTPPEQVDQTLADDTVAAMQAAVDNAITASGASGAIVGVWVPWSGTWVSATGTQDRDGGKLSTDMAFRVADVTRLMSCDVLYALADEGRVKLTDPVTKYVSGVADLAEVTLLDLCNGTSGLGSSEPTVRQMFMETPERVWAPLELASFGLGRSRTAPGTGYADSDAGFVLLGLALERATSMTSAELIEEYVAAPLGLTGTSLPGTAAAKPGAGAALDGHYMKQVEGGYDCAAPVDITVASSSFGFTDSGAVSTITDLGRYVQAEAAQGQPLRKKDEPDRYSAPLPAYNGAPSWYQATGGALVVGSLIGQTGWAPGYATAAFADPATGLTVAVVLNDSTAGGSIPGYLAWELAAIASKAVAAEGQTAPEVGLPFTAEQYHEEITKAALVCVAPAAE